MRGVELFPAVRAGQRVRGIAESGGALWIALGDGLYRRPNAEPTMAPTRVREGKAGVMVPGLDGAAIGRAGRSVLRLGDSVSELWRAASDVSAVAALRDGALVVATTEGRVSCIRDGTATAITVGFGVSSILAIVEGGAGTVWLGADGGLIEAPLGGGIGRIFRVGEGLPHYRAEALTVAADGDIWVGTPAGLSRVRPEWPVRTLDRLQGMGALVPFAVTEGRSGRIWVATSRGLAAWDGSTFYPIGVDGGFAERDVRGVAEDRDGQVWAAGMNTGLFKITDGRAIRVSSEPMRALRPRSDGGLWVGGAEGGLFTWHEGRLDVLIPRGLGSRRAHDLLEDDEGGVWIALAGGALDQWKAGSVRRVYQAPGQVDLLFLSRGAGGALWVGTDGQGLLRVSATKISRVTASQGLPDDRVHALVDDGAGRTWMSSPRGISFFSTTALERVTGGEQARLEATTLGFEDGVEGEPIKAYPPSFLRARDGTLYFPTMKGLVQVDPRAVRELKKPLPPVVDDIQVNGRSATSVDPPPSAGSFDLLARFAVPTLQTPRPVRLLYRLTPLQSAWQEAGLSREARFERLPPGRYQFQVAADTAARGSPTPGPIVTAAVNLPTPWHTRGVARLGGLALLASVVALIYRGRVRRLQRLHGAVLAERSRIAADIHDSLEQNLAGLRLQVEAAAMTLDRDLPSTRENLRSMAELIQDGVVDLRSSIGGLRSTPVDTGQLAAALEAKVRRVTVGTSIGASVETSGATQQLSWYQATQILYIAREALANALKHASASRIRIALGSSTPGELLLSVHDDGVAVAGRSQALAGGTGVAGMKRRAELLGGHLTLAQGDGPGTEVRLQVPIGETPSSPRRWWRRRSGGL